MRKKLIISIVIIILIAAGISAYFVFKPRKPYFTDDPATWVDRTDMVTRTVNIEKATKGQAYDSVNSVYFAINGTTTAFLYEGYYEGEYFQKEYSRNGDVLMRIGPDIKPNDGIIEGFVVERVIDGVYDVLVFLDNDWRQQIPNTNIVWGSSYERVKPFAFNEISSGVYMDQIEDDPERFSFNHMQSNTAIIVGGITQEQVLQGATEGITVIVFQ